MAPVNGFNQPITLIAIGLPPGASANFSPNLLLPGSGADLTVTTAEIIPGTYAIAIQGSAESLTHSATVQLRVKNPQEDPLSLRRSFSSENPILLMFRYQQQTSDEATAIVMLSNLTGTWVKAVMNTMAGDLPVPVNDKLVPSIILLGPFATKVVTVHPGEAQTPCPERFWVVVSCPYDSITLVTRDMGADTASGPGDDSAASGGARPAAGRSGPVEGDGRRVGTEVGAQLAELFAAPVGQSTPSPEPTGASRGKWPSAWRATRP